MYEPRPKLELLSGKDNYMGLGAWITKEYPAVLLQQAEDIAELPAFKPWYGRLLYWLRKY